MHLCELVSSLAAFVLATICFICNAHDSVADPATTDAALDLDPLCFACLWDAIQLHNANYALYADA